MKKQFDSVAEVFEDTKKKIKVEQKQGLETANITELQKIIDDVHRIMMQFGSNSEERSRLADAENALYDAREIIQNKDLKGEYKAW